MSSFLLFDQLEYLLGKLKIFISENFQQLLYSTPSWGKFLLHSSKN